MVRGQLPDGVRKHTHLVIKKDSALKGANVKGLDNLFLCKFLLAKVPHFLSHKITNLPTSIFITKLNRKKIYFVQKDFADKIVLFSQYSFN